MSIDNIQDTDEEKKSNKTPEITTQLGNLSEEVLSKPVLDIVKNISEKPDFITPKEGFNPEEIGKLIEEKKFGEVFSKVSGRIMDLFSAKRLYGFSHLSNEKTTLELEKKIKNKSVDELQKDINTFLHQIENNKKISSLSDITDIVFLLSEAKDALNIIKYQTEKNTQQRPNKYELFMKELVSPEEKIIGKTLLFNRGKTSGKGNMARDFLNKGIQSFGSQREHSVIITGYDKSTGDLEITHADAKGVVKEPLKKYLKRHETELDVMCLDLPDGYGKKVSDFVDNNIGAGYDYLGMMKDVFSGTRTNANNKFYCSELIIDGLVANGYSISPNSFRPGQLIKELKPSYCTTIDTKLVN